MKEIPLTQGKIALVDDEDYEELSKYKWCAHKEAKTFYALRNSRVFEGFGKTIYMHREVMNTPKGMVTDHINGNGLDNRKENIRECLHSDNMRNSKNRITNTTGYRGVCRHKNGWESHIKVDNRNIYLGRYTTKEEAYKAYCEASKKYHGEFSNVG